MSAHDDPEEHQVRPEVAAPGVASDRADMYWAELLGIDPEEWMSPGISFRSHRGLQGYRGLWCFRRGDRIVVSAPQAWVARLEELWTGWDLERLLDAAAVAASLGEDCERTIGPAFHGCVDPCSFQDVASPRVRRVLESDRAGIGRLRERCGEDAWSVSGLGGVGAIGYIYLDGVEITAMAGLREKSDKVGDLCVLTDPRLRGEGRGAATVSAVTRDALASGCLVLYQTLEANHAAVRLALSLGFARYGIHLAVRLAGPNAEHGGP